MRARRLGWAGLELESGGSTLLVDAIVDTSPLLSLRSADEPFPSPSRRGAVGALVTHLHADHADPQTIADYVAESGVVLRPEPAEGKGDDIKWTSRAEEAFAKHGLTPTIALEWSTNTIGPFRVIAVPAVDGLGDPQRNWIIQAEDRTVFHGGDTLFHGYWWLIARRYGPIDVAFVPINGAVVNFEHLQPPSPIPAAMTPEQGAVASSILGARRAVPIHYGSLHKPPVYVETENAEGRFRDEAVRRGVEPDIRTPGERFDI